MIKMDKYKIEQKIIPIGNSQGIIIPKDILNYIGNPESVYIMPDKSKHGKFLAVFNVKQKQNNYENNMVEEEP